MKNSIKVFALCLAMVFTTFSVQAQKANLEEKVKKETDEVATALGLDEATAQKVYELNLTAAQEKNVVRQNYNAKKKAGEKIDKDAKKAEMTSIGKAQNAAIKEVLGKEKGKAYQAFKKEQRKARKKEKKD